MASVVAEPIQASLDADGRIIMADEALLRLQVDAGGVADGPVAISALADLVRLVKRLQIPISRAVEVASGDADISMWVQLRPDGDGMALSIVDWQERTPRELSPDTSKLKPVDEAREATGWPWQVDAYLRFRRIDQDAETLGHQAPRIGEPLTAFFQLDAGVDGESFVMPMVEALALRAPFMGQLGRLRADQGVRYRISGEPLFDNHGGLMGYRGRAIRIEEDAATSDIHAEQESGPNKAEAVNLFGPELGRRLDQALRQPIGRIIANASTISGQLQGPLRQDYAEYAADIATAGRHLLELVDDLADLQAIDRPGFTTAQEEVDLADLARRAAGLLNVRASARQVRIQTPALGEKALARAEYRRVLQILVNLIGNAVRHSPAESTIWVLIDEENGRAKAVVADQGTGIDPPDHERIFERFERLGLSGDEGSGLGLYISRRLARAMAGDVTVESALGQGARFTLDLPGWTGR
jgi:signal transduction histidine kinase